MNYCLSILMTKFLLETTMLCTAVIPSQVSYATSWTPSPRFLRWSLPQLVKWDRSDQQTGLKPVGRPIWQMLGVRWFASIVWQTLCVCKQRNCSFSSDKAEIWVRGNWAGGGGGSGVANTCNTHRQLHAHTVRRFDARFQCQRNECALPSIGDVLCFVNIAVDHKFTNKRSAAQLAAQLSFFVVPVPFVVWLMTNTHAVTSLIALLYFKIFSKIHSGRPIAGAEAFFIMFSLRKFVLLTLIFSHCTRKSRCITQLDDGTISKLFQNYSSQIPPERPTKVTVNFLIKSVALDQTKMQMHIDMRFRHMWKDARLNFTKVRDLKLLAKHAHLLWVPNLSFRWDTAQTRFLPWLVCPL